MPVLTASLTIIGSVILLVLNARSNRRQEIFKRKEERYAKLIESLKGFYVNTLNRELKSEFLNQVNLCWMYCPDSVILKAYTFLFTIHTHPERDYSDKDKEEAVGDFILEIRKDLLSNKRLTSTKLTPSDFKHLTVT